MGMFENDFDEERGEELQADEEVDGRNKAATIKTLTINAKCSDMATIIGKDADGREVMRSETNGMMHGINLGGGDYVRFVIDIEIGQILNWKKPDPTDLYFDFKGEL
jgi:hypothetical protein